MGSHGLFPASGHGYQPLFFLDAAGGDRTHLKEKYACKPRSKSEPRPLASATSANRGSLTFWGGKGKQTASLAAKKLSREARLGNDAVTIYVSIWSYDGMTSPLCAEIFCPFSRG